MNFFGGPCQRTVPNAGKRVFLTFDDGPTETFTPALLAWCEREKVPATFFLVAERARRFPELTRALSASPHTVGNHSLDHNYGNFFLGRARLRSWIDRAQTELRGLTGRDPVAFRSPAGVQTPELAGALKDLALPLVHWNHRFFDTKLAFTTRKASRAAAAAKAGDIFLLHDMPHRDPEAFLAALSTLVRELRARGLEPASLHERDVRG
jgi:peptidoglycan/xylan/chitin deacetylase (PgdA/CDA1 family)